MRIISRILPLMAVLLLLAGCEPYYEPIELPSTYVPEYKGEKLGSLEDFRENSIKGPQHVDIEKYRLRITGLVNEEKEYTYDEILNNYQSYEKIVTLDCVEGWSVKILWEGILVKDLLNEAEISDDAKILIFHAEDGYSSTFLLDEFMSKDIIMAYKMNNITLPPTHGFPFQLVAENKWGYKWIKWITEIEVSDDIDYRGNWEIKGKREQEDVPPGYTGGSLR